MTGSLYFDFETNVNQDFFLLAVRYQGETTQFVLDERLSGAAEAKQLPIVDPLAKSQAILDLAQRESLSLVAYSEIEAEDLQHLFGGDIPARYLDISYINLAKAARTWINAFHREAFDALGPYLPAEQVGQMQSRRRQYNNSLASRMRVTDFPPPRGYGYGKTTLRIKAVMSGLEFRDQDYSALTNTQKSKWTNVLKHSRYDVEALEHLEALIRNDRPSILERATKTLGDIASRARANAEE